MFSFFADFAFAEISLFIFVVKLHQHIFYYLLFNNEFFYKEELDK